MREPIDDRRSSAVYLLFAKIPRIFPVVSHNRIEDVSAGRIEVDRTGS